MADEIEAKIRAILMPPSAVVPDAVVTIAEDDDEAVAGAHTQRERDATSSRGN